MIKIQGLEYTVEVHEGAEAGVYNYHVHPPIHILDQQAFTALLDEEINYQDIHGGITSQPQDIAIGSHALTHQTTDRTWGRIELARTPDYPNYVDHKIGHALMFLVAPYARKPYAV